MQQGDNSYVKLRYCVNHITPTCWNDDYTILCKFSGCIMSGLMLWLLLASTFSELACLWFATWGLEFYWARKASFFWTWCTKEREQLCFLSGWKMWRLLVIYSIFINLTYKLKPLNQRGNNQGLCCVFLISLRDTVASAYCSFLK